MDFLDQLNTQQKNAVTAENGPVLVVAGPGSGKTRVLTQRIAYLIAVEGVRPWQILAVTFTNKAAKEMQERVKHLLPDQAVEGIMLGTFHSICARIMRREAEYLPVESNFVIFDSDDQERIVKSVIRELNINEKLYRPASVHGSISRAKNELINAEQYPTTTYRDEIVKRVYVEYQKRLIASNAVDFDDMLVYTAKLLDDNPSVRDKYAQRFRHVLVDEFQDTNLAQYALVQQLASHHKNIFCVGDPDQSIYAWRGADWRNIQRFEQDFPDAQTILLEQNYRSKQTILNAAMGVIDRAQGRRRRKQLFSDRGKGENIFFYEAPDDYAEASFVVDTIAQLVASKQFEPGDCAVMYRTNAMSRLLEEAFLQARLPYRLVGAQRFYGRREVKDIIAFLRLVHNPADEAGLNRIINVPPRGIGNKTLTTLNMVARQNELQPGEILLDLARGADSPYWASFTNRASISLADMGGMLANWRIAAQTLTIPELFDRIISDTGYKEYIDDDSDEGKDRWENILELKRLAEEYSTRTMDEFLENIALISDQDTITEGNVPTLLTLHAAKGLEFGAVFIIGLDDGILPHSRSFDEPEQMEEERRLFYVGITRAKDKLYLVRSIQRGGRHMMEETYPSRYMDDIPAELLVGRTRTGRNLKRGVVPETKWALHNRSESASVREAVYRAGTRIKHPTWGEGIVLDSKIQDDDEIVDVVFESVGIKRLSASLANLKII